MWAWQGLEKAEPLAKLNTDSWWVDIFLASKYLNGDRRSEIQDMGVQSLGQALKKLGSLQTIDLDLNGEVIKKNEI